MFRFINKYNSIGEFLSDDNLVYDIGKNIVLEDLNSDEISLKEFNDCNFLTKINSKLTHKYIDGTLSQINNFKKFYLYFIYIYIVKKEEEKDENILDSFNLIISRFLEVLTNFSKLSINEEFKSTFQKIMILSLMYVPIDDNNNYKNIIKELGKSHLYSKSELFYLFIEEIINPNLENYISHELKIEISKYIIETFYFDLNIDKKIDILIKIE